jgi:hypothetical protein
MSKKKLRAFVWIYEDDAWELTLLTFLEENVTNALLFQS